MCTSGIPPYGSYLGYLAAKRTLGQGWGDSRLWDIVVGQFRHPGVSVALMLETDDDVVGIANHDHVAHGRAPSPALGQRKLKK